MFSPWLFQIIYSNQKDLIAVERSLSERNPPWCLLFNAPSTSKHKLRSLTSCSDWLLLKLCDQSVGVNRSSGNDTPQCKSTTESVPHAGPSNMVSPTKHPEVGVRQTASCCRFAGQETKITGRSNSHHRRESGSKPASHKNAAAYYCSWRMDTRGGGRTASDMFRGDEYFMMPAERSVRLIICETFTAEWLSIEVHASSKRPGDCFGKLICAVITSGSGLVLLKGWRWGGGEVWGEVAAAVGASIRWEGCRLFPSVSSEFSRRSGSTLGWRDAAALKGGQAMFRLKAPKWVDEVETQQRGWGRAALPRGSLGEQGGDGVTRWCGWKISAPVLWPQKTDLNSAFHASLGSVNASRTEVSHQWPLLKAPLCSRCQIKYKVLKISPVWCHKGR